MHSYSSWHILKLKLNLMPMHVIVAMRECVWSCTVHTDEIEGDNISAPDYRTAGKSERDKAM